MALIPCPECGRQISTEAQACPGCGYPMGQPNRPVAAAAQKRSVPVASNEILMEVRPSWWNFGWHLFFFWLLIPLFIALYKRHSFLMRIYTDRVSIAEGFWAKETSEFFIKDIRAIEVYQGFWGRIVGIGDVTISTAATIDAAEVANGVAAPQAIKELLIAQRQQISAPQPD